VAVVVTDSQSIPLNNALEAARGADSPEALVRFGQTV
jgi:hypothetical protein